MRAILHRMNARADKHNTSLSACLSCVLLSLWSKHVRAAARHRHGSCWEDGLMRSSGSKHCSRLLGLKLEACVKTHPSGISTPESVMAVLWVQIRSAKTTSVGDLDVVHKAYILSHFFLPVKSEEPLVRSQRVRHVIPNRSEKLTAERVPSEKNILEASQFEISSVTLESPVETAASNFRLCVACRRCAAPCHPPPASSSTTTTPLWDWERRSCSELQRGSYDWGHFQQARCAVEAGGPPEGAVQGPSCLPNTNGGKISHDWD